MPLPKAVRDRLRRWLAGMAEGQAEETGAGVEESPATPRADERTLHRAIDMRAVRAVVVDKLIKAGPGLVIRVAVTPHELPEVLLPHGAAPSASRGVVMDIETCGLRSMPIFLAGFLDVAHGRISQLLACHYAAEPELLRHVAEIVERADALVTYNGAAFDLPFLMDRMRYWRLGELKLPAHADLLGLLRRQVEAWLPNLRLATVEAELLGRVRIHDVAGSDIPQIYARFVEAQDMRVIAPVLAHNLVDMLSCWALARLLDV